VIWKNGQTGKSVLLKNPRKFLKIINETAVFKPAGFIVRSAQDRGRMNGSHYVRREGRLNKFSALFGDAKFWAEQCLSSRGAERNYYFWFDDGDLGFKPGATSRDLLSIRFFMDTPFATRFPFEMFDNIRYVGLRTIDAGLGKRIIKQPAGWTNERFARQIFFVARLLADEQNDSAPAAFAKHGLRAAFPKVTRFAIGSGGAQ
jgi:hypothetical protein